MYDAVIILLTIALIHYGVTFYYGLWKRVRALLHRKSEMRIPQQQVKEPARESKEGGEDIYA